jgi:hypothetical protein
MQESAKFEPLHEIMRYLCISLDNEIIDGFFNDVSNMYNATCNKSIAIVIASPARDGVDNSARQVIRTDSYGCLFMHVLVVLWSWSVEPLLTAMHTVTEQCILML